VNHAINYFNRTLIVF